MTEAVELLAKQFFLNDRSAPVLILAGCNGVGKTHCGRALAAWGRAVAVEAWSRGHWSKPPTVSFVRWAEFIESDSGGVERDAREADLSILDDVGAETDRFKSGAPIDKLCQILGCREKRFTLIASNLTVGQWAERDARVADRMLRGSVIVSLKNTKSWWVMQQEKKGGG